VFLEEHAVCEVWLSDGCQGGADRRCSSEAGCEAEIGSANKTAEGLRSGSEEVRWEEVEAEGKG
jgi:hypothetical protein